MPNIRINKKRLRVESVRTNTPRMDNVWVNGQQGQLITTNDRGLNYGDGLFLTMRVNADGIIHFLESHISRIKQAVYRLNFRSQEQLWQLPEVQIDLLKEIALANPNSGIKLLISRGVGGRGYSAVNCSDITTVISIFELPSHYSQLQKSGVRLLKSEVQLASQPLLAGLKHLNRLEQVLIKSYSIDDGFDDWLVVDSNNNVIEASMANLFFLRDGAWITPTISRCGVAGVMREQVIYQLLELGFNVEMTDIAFNELKQIEHIFMTNSLMGAIDVTQITDMSFNKWELTKSLNKSLGVSL